MRVWRQRDALDHRLADGEVPSSGDLAIRAEQLTSANCRHRIAAELEAALSVGDLPCHERAPSKVDIRREVVAARSDLEVLIERLRACEPVRAAGVAMCLWLLRDQASPLYEPSPEDELGRAVRWALAGLD